MSRQNKVAAFFTALTALAVFAMPVAAGGFGQHFAAIRQYLTRVGITPSGAGITSIVFGSADTNGVRLDLESGALAVREGDDSGYAQINAGGVEANGAVNLTGGGLTIDDAYNAAFGTSGDAGIGFLTAQTVDTLVTQVDSTGRMLLIVEQGDAGTDFAHGAQTNPKVIVQSADQTDVTQFIGFMHNQTSAELHSGSGGFVLSDGGDGVGDATLACGGITANGGVTIPDDQTIKVGGTGDRLISGEVTALTDGSATTVFSVVMADGDMAGLEITYTIQATDLTEYQAEHGRAQIAIVDDAGGVVASTVGKTRVQALSSGTLTSAWTVVTTDDQSIEVQLNADTSLTIGGGSIQVRWSCNYTGDVSLTVP